MTLNCHLLDKISVVHPLFKCNICASLDKDALLYKVSYGQTDAQTHNATAAIIYPHNIL